MSYARLSSDSQESLVVQSSSKKSNPSLISYRSLSLILALLVFIAFFGLPSHHFDSLPIMGSAKHSYSYQALSGFFVQADNATSDTNFDVWNGVQRFGLKLASWDGLRLRLQELNDDASEEEAYKCLFVSRHGQGYHNVALDKFGQIQWDCYWSMKNTDGEMTWAPDPELTAQGRSEAAIAHAAWKRELALGAPLPQSYYSSPLSRSALTAQITWKDLKPEVQPIVVKEKWRETIGLHTCDQRSTKSHIHKTFPDFTFEDDFTEEDKLFTLDSMETGDQQTYRHLEALDDLFDNDSNHIISISCHSGSIEALLRGVHHRPFAQSTGSMIPLVLKLTKNGPPRVKPDEHRNPAPECPADPRTKEEQKLER